MLGVACAAGLLALLPAAGGAAVRTDGLIPVKFSLPAAKSGESYSFSIMGAATGGVKPYRCVPQSLNVGTLELGRTCVISGNAPTLKGGSTKSITGPFTFKLTDTGNPPKTITLYPLNFTTISNAEEHPFDGTWKIKETATATLTCPDGDPPTVRSSTVSFDATVVNDTYQGHALAISPTGVSATVTIPLDAAGLKGSETYTFAVAGAATSVHGSGTATGSPAGCDLKTTSTDSGSRTST